MLNAMVKNQTSREGYRESRAGVGAEFLNLNLEFKFLNLWLFFLMLLPKNIFTFKT